MSSLHTRYRPSKLSELIGQGFIKKALSGALQRNLIAPAYLFVGSRGTGKTSTARILAKSLNCSNGVTIDPCGQCSSCKSIDQGSSLDVVEIDAASNSGVDDARELRSSVQLSPVNRFRVFIIDECHMLSTAAQNALLKTLEEPPRNVVFILATTDPQKVLPTIRSRCHEFKFSFVPQGDLITLLKDIATKESITITDDALKVIATVTNGGVRDAQTLLATLSTLDSVGVNDVYEALGALSPVQVLSVLDAIERHDVKVAMGQVRSILTLGADPKALLDTIITLYRDVLSYLSTGSKEFLTVTPDVKIEEIKTTPTACIEKLERLCKASATFNTVSQASLNVWLECLVMELSLMKSNATNTSINTPVINPGVSAKVSANARVKALDDTSVNATNDTSVTTPIANPDTSVVNPSISPKTTTNTSVNSSGDDVTAILLSNMSRLSQKRFETCQFLSSGVVLFDDEHSATLAQSSVNKVMEAYSKAGLTVTEIEYRVK